METTTIVPRVSREREFKWMEQNRAVADKYRGQWICVEGEELVASSPSFSVVLKEAKHKQIEVPFIFYVSERVENDVLNL